MDPIQVMRTVWRHRLMALPVIVLTLVAVVYVAKWGPRSFESTASYVLISPRAPSTAEILKDPSLADVSADNPYLRTSSDPALAAQVVISTMNSERTVQALADQGIPTEYSAQPGSGSGGSSIITFTATAGTAEQSLKAMDFLGSQLLSILKDVQTANGADDRYLISAIEVDASEHAVEKVSSRLRTIVVVATGGLVLLFAVMSLAQARENSARRRRSVVQAVPPQATARREPRRARKVPSRHAVIGEESPNEHGLGPPELDSGTIDFPSSVRPPRPALRRASGDDLSADE